MNPCLSPCHLPQCYLGCGGHPPPPCAPTHCPSTQPHPSPPPPNLELGEELRVQSVSRDGRASCGCQVDRGFLCGARAVGEEEAAPPLSSRPSAAFERLVQFVTLGPECTVCFRWPLSSSTLAVSYLYPFSSSGILLSGTGCHLPTSLLSPPAHRVSPQAPWAME